MVLLRVLALEADAGRELPAHRLAWSAGCDGRLRQPLPEERREPLVLEVAGGRDHDVPGGVRRAVIRGKGTPAHGRDHVGAADHRPPERVPAEDGLRDHVVDEVLRVVLHHRDLLQDDLPLGVDVVEGGVVDHAGHHVEGRLEPVVRDACVDDRRLARGGRVQLAAETVEELRDLLGAVRPGALEEQVLDEVRDPGTGVRLVARARADPEADRDGADAWHALGDHALARRQLRELVLLHRPIVAVSPRGQASGWTPCTA